nr:MAG TPA: hypothetical protein [Caudoviricetes sp.]DAV67389.1 MAG TPA: hypothetical protein [Caudoviricetes sp.]
MIDILTLKTVQEAISCTAGVLIIVYFVMSIIHLIKKW